MHDQLGERAVEGAVRKRKLLGRAGLHVDLREARADRRDERAGRIDRRHGTGTRSLDQLRGQPSGSAADIQHPLTSPYTGQEIRELNSPEARKNDP